MKTAIVCLVGIILLAVVALICLANIRISRKVTIMETSSAAWLAFVAAIVSATIVAVSGFWLHYANQSGQRKHEILQERKIALFDALKVIDLVYANEPLTGQAPLNPKEWDIELARDAMNKMIIYCRNPQRTVGTFRKAIGLHNLSVAGSSPGVNLESLEEFRKQVARELKLPEVTFTDPNMVWIASLAGTAEAKESERQRSQRTSQQPSP